MPVAVEVKEHGGPEALGLIDRPTPKPGTGQVVVDVAAIGVNFIEIYQRTGVYQVSLPFPIGSEAAGTVSAIGEGVTDFSIGDRVAWTGIQGSYAAQVLAPADRLVAVPDGVTDQQAAALPLQGMTAHYLASDSHPISAGETVLIHAGAGGVGLLLTQIAKIKGARVVTTVSTEDKAELSRAAGADEVVVGYAGFPERVKELTGGEGVAAVYDGVGKDTFDDSLSCLRRRGMMVLFGGASGQVPPFDLQRLNRGGSLSITRPTLNDFIITRPELLARAADLFGWVADGRLQVRIGGSYPLAEAGQAQSDLAARKTTGKLLLIP